jgi:hypothetical protein
MKYILKESFGLSDNQCNLIMVYNLSFIVSTIYMYFTNKDKFDFKWCIICFVLALMYNVAYYKFFSD